MKKCLFMVVVLLMTSISFASTANETIKKPIENKEAFLVQNFFVEYDFAVNLLNDSCFVSCTANIYYNGRLVKQINAGAVAGDCVTANQDCGRKAYEEALSYIAQVEEVLGQN